MQLGMASDPANRPRPRWDLFCRVIDNHGDIGVCWRLACELARRGAAVRLITDDASALAWMAPTGHEQVHVVPWPGAGFDGAEAKPAAVVIEAFGCDPPPAYVQAMAQHEGPAPIWINLEYLSAEAYVERSHGLPSPQPSGLTKWFFYPGFTSRTGGLLHETDLLARQAAFDRKGWLHSHGIGIQPGERLVSLFCYPNPALPALLQRLAARPTRLLLTPGAAQQALECPAPGLQMQALPWLTQPGYDELLWACDLNFVRGEDSLVRASWAGKPFVWQAYPQHDGAHHAKVAALLDLLQPEAEVAALWWWWNGMAALPPDRPDPPALPDLAGWQRCVHRWRQRLLQQDSLADQLLAFVHAKGNALVAPPARI
jgi:uncharacterized repeat protein (TIGR03837 family)